MVVTRNCRCAVLLLLIIVSILFTGYRFILPATTFLNIQCHDLNQSSKDRGFESPYISNELTKSHDYSSKLVMSHEKNNKLHCPCKTFRDISSESQEDRTLQLEEFPGIFSSCGGNSPVLLSKYNVTPDSLNRTDRYLVPNVVHYVWFGDPLEISFLNYLSLLSVHKFLKADYTFIHGNSIPTGQWWTKVINSIPNIYHVKRTQPEQIHGKKIVHTEHCADVARLEILLGE